MGQLLISESFAIKGAVLRIAPFFVLKSIRCAIMYNNIVSLVSTKKN